METPDNPTWLQFLVQAIVNYFEVEKPNVQKYLDTRSLGALRAPTSIWRPFGPALGPSGLLDFVHQQFENNIV